MDELEVVLRGWTPRDVQSVYRGRLLGPRKIWIFHSGRLVDGAQFSVYFIEGGHNAHQKALRQDYIRLFAARAVGEVIWHASAPRFCIWTKLEIRIYERMDC
jgi:hypothetical protein